MFEIKSFDFKISDFFVKLTTAKKLNATSSQVRKKFLRQKLLSSIFFIQKQGKEKYFYKLKPPCCLNQSINFEAGRCLISRIFKISNQIKGCFNECLHIPRIDDALKSIFL